MIWTLEVCPFCKKDSMAVWRIGTLENGYWTVGCDNCLCHGPRAETKGGAIELWNKRGSE